MVGWDWEGIGKGSVWDRDGVRSVTSNDNELNITMNYTYNRNGQFKIVLTEDGCWRKDLTTIIPSLSAMRRTFRELMRIGYKADNLDVMDCETGRYISFCINRLPRQ